MGLSDAFGEVLGIPEPSARFLLALFSAYPFAFVYRSFVARQLPRAKNFFFTVCGAWMLYYVYGVGIWHSFLDIILVYIVLLVSGGSQLGVTLTWIITMGHLVLGYIYLMSIAQVHPISWTIPHCVLVLKLIGLSYNLYDAKQKPESLSEDTKERAVYSMPSFLEVTGFSYFYGSVLAGPQMPFVRYRAFAEGKLFDIDTTPSSVPAGIQRLLVGIFFSVLYSVLNQFYPISFLATQAFADEIYVRKMWLVFISGKVALWRYITVWLIAEGSCIVTGISYGGEDKQGKVNWHALANIHIVKNELCLSLQGVIDSFNINTNQWVAWYTFKRLRWMGNKTLSYVVTLLFVSLWHGVWPGYLLNFSFELIGIFAERTFVGVIKQILGSSLSDVHVVIRLPLSLLAFVLKNIVLMYPVTMFMLLSWEHCFKFMSAVYFYGHAIVVGWMLLHYTVIGPLSKPKKKQE